MSDRLWLLRANEVASRSLDPSLKVGAVVVARGGASFERCNAFPDGIAVTQERLEDRNVRLMMTVHAEVRALLCAGPAARGATLYVTHWPCARCAAVAIEAGIVRVVIPDQPVLERWRVEQETASAMLAEAGVAFEKIAAA